MISKSSLFCKILDIDIFLAIQRSEAFGFKPHYRAPSTDHSESLKRCIVLVMAPTHIDIYVYVYIYIYIHTHMYVFATVSFNPSLFHRHLWNLWTLSTGVRPIEASGFSSLGSEGSGGGGGGG